MTQTTTPTAAATIREFRRHAAAKAALLADLGHGITGSLQAGIDGRLIREESCERRMATVYTHPDLPGREYYVDWQYGL